MKNVARLLFLLSALALSSGAYSETIASGKFSEKEKSISGSWTIESENGLRTLKISENFKAKKGPDLKIFFSPKSFKDTSGKNATHGSILLAELKNPKGGQTYSLPSDLDLTDLKSLLVYCEKFAVLWGGSDL